MGPNERYNWNRFWCRRDGRIALDQGYVLDPEAPAGSRVNPDVVPFEEIATKPCLILLGEPGIGKSHAIRVEKDSARLRLQTGEELVIIDLGLKRDPVRDLFDHPTFRGWKQGRSVLHLFIDSLDECPLQDIGQRLIGELGDGPIEKLRLRLACRTAELPRIIDSELPGLWKDAKNDVGFYELVPLRRRDVIEAAGTDAEALLAEIARQRAESLAIKPITLRFLLNLFRRHRALPKTRHDLYLDGCRILCEEANDRRKDLEQIGRLSAQQRLAVAARIAAVFVFGRRGSIWRNLDLGDVPDDAILEQDLCGRAERVQGGDLDVTEAAIAETLGTTGLFTSRGPGQLGWAHQTYPEFLAARFLEQRGLTVDQMLELITHPGDRRRVAPMLRETAAWLASMKPEIFYRILESDPLVLLRSDVAMVDDVGREQLVGGLLDRIERREVIDLDFTHGDDVRKLYHPRLAVQLTPYITDRSRYFMTRRAAMAIAEQCKVTELQGALASVALDASEPANLRTEAARAVTILGDDATLTLLVPLAFGQIGDDPNDELKGCALKALWPKFLDSAQLFVCLTQPKRPFSLGGYYVFHRQPIERQLDLSDLPTALAWVERQPKSEVHPSWTAGLAERIMRRAWQHLDDPPTLAAFARAAKSRLDEHGPIFRKGSSYESFGEEPNVLLADAERRHLVVNALIGTMPERKYEPHELESCGLLTTEDLSWALQCLKDTTGTAQRQRWARVIDRLWTATHYDARASDLVLQVAEQVAELQEAIGPPFCDIDSPGAVKAKESLAQWKKWNREHEQYEQYILKPPPDELVRACLDRFEQGDSDAWWQLHLEMTLEPTSRYYGHEDQPELIAFPGWIRADEPTKARILAAAKKYLLQHDAAPDQWIGTSTTFRPATAGYRALRLLLRLDSAAVESLSQEVWQRWVTIVLGYPIVGGSEDGAGLHRRLVCLAYKHAPEEFLWALGILIDKENRDGDAIYITRHLTTCWDDRLAGLLLAKVSDPSLKPGCMRSLLGELLQLGVAGAREFALSLLQMPIPTAPAAQGRAQAVGVALVVHAGKLCWPALSAIAQNDPSFVREIFLEAAGRMRDGHQNGAWAEQLSEDDVAELYLWLVREFPPAQDRSEEYDGRVQGVHPRDRVAEIRDGLLCHLAARGTPSSRDAVERIRRALPDRDEIGFALINAREATLQQTWKPLQTEHILGLLPTRSTPQPTAASMTSANDSTSIIAENGPLFAWMQISDIHAGHGQLHISGTSSS